MRERSIDSESVCVCSCSKLTPNDGIPELSWAYDQRAIERHIYIGRYIPKVPMNHHGGELHTHAQRETGVNGVSWICALGTATPCPCCVPACQYSETRLESRCNRPGGSRTRVSMAAVV